MDERILEQASQWLLKQADKPLPEQEKNEFDNWLAESEAHRNAYRQMQALWQHLPQSEALQAHQQSSTRQSSAQQSSTTQAQPGGKKRSSSWLSIDWRAPVLAFSLLIAVFFGWFLQPDPIVETQIYATQVGEINQIELTDGSVITLGGNTQLVVSLQEQQRNVRLHKGEAYFDVAHDKTRPFVVTNDETQIKVLGTEFAVQALSTSLQLEVAQGAVEITDMQAIYYNRVKNRVLTAGEAITYSDTKGLTEVAKVDGELIGNWRDKRFNFNNQTLDAIAERLNLYYPPGIVIASDSLKHKAINSSFRLEQLDTFLAGLSMSDDIDVIKREDGKIIITKV